jgi:hypothetical protein
VREKKTQYKIYVRKTKKHTGRAASSGNGAGLGLGLYLLYALCGKETNAPNC